MQSFDILYARPLLPLFELLRMGPRFSSIEVTPSHLRVRMGFWFAVTIDRNAISAVRRERDMFWSVGVHTSFRGTWIVNGSPRNTVMMTIDPPAQGRSAGFRVKVKTLALSPADPDALIRALGSPPHAQPAEHR